MDYQKFDRHAALVTRMADTVGADFGAALVEGRMAGQELRNAIYRCTGCDEPEACKHWLDSKVASGAEVPPGYCRNSDLLARLRG